MYCIYRQLILQVQNLIQTTSTQIMFYVTRFYLAHFKVWVFTAVSYVASCVIVMREIWNVNFNSVNVQLESYNVNIRSSMACCLLPCCHGNSPQPRYFVNIQAGQPENNNVADMEQKYACLDVFNIQAVKLHTSYLSTASGPYLNL